MNLADDLVPLTGGGRSVVHRRGDIVLRNAGPWTPAVHAVHAVLRHLEDVGFPAAPRLVGSGLDHDGREMLTFIDGEFTQPGPWSLEGAAALGRTLRDLHRATGSFQPPRTRRGSPGTLIEFAICDTAWEADDADITPETSTHPIALWAMAWRARSVAWMIRHRRTLETALTRRSP